jgi:Holliday junction resolvase RusA-like endonuclease
MSKPAITITVYGQPAPQGSKKPIGNNRMIEQVKGVKPWRQDVKTAGLAAMEAGHIGSTAIHRLPFDGPLVAEMVFTVRDKPASKPTWWPSTRRWSRLLWWRPAGAPDLSKLARSTEDALTQAGVWKDDARVVEYRRLAKVFVDQPGEPDALHVPGAVIRIWPLGPTAPSGELRVYLAGPMRGIAEQNFPAFHAATRALRDGGVEVWSPAEYDLSQGHDPTGTSGSEAELAASGFDIRGALCADLTWICKEADVVIVLPGWEHSRGALAEVWTAHAIGIPVITLADFLRHGVDGPRITPTSMSGRSA